jgi:hypothetical protein
MSKSNFSQFGKKKSTPWSDKFTVVYGNYAWLNDRPIHYCLTTVSISNLWDDIRLMGEISGVEKWGFEALFQRVVREEWVKAIKSQYLESRERFKFFPPVTIALLPCELNRPARAYSGGKSFLFTQGEESGCIASLEGLEMEFPTATDLAFPDFGNPALVRWDKSRYTALAIDGQHRISALRRLVPRGDQQAGRKDVPATILIFDPHLPVGRDLVQLTREIFIDINKNAKTVDDSRLILLDDRNFYSGLTRKLILQAYPDGETPAPVVFERIDESQDLNLPIGIPQELVDTAAGRDAADVGKLKDWQYTSAFILNRSLQYFVFENRFERFEELLETQDFASDSEKVVEAAVARRREIYENGYDDDDEMISDADMLSFRPSITEELVRRAMSRHRGILLGPFTAFAPYRKHIQKFAHAIAGDDGDSLRALMLSEASIPGKPAFETQTAQDLKSDDVLFKRIKNILKTLSRPSGWEESLVWYSVFQRGLIFQPSMLRKAMEAARGEGFDSRQHFAAEFVRSLDVIESERWFEKSARSSGKGLWNGIALKLGDSGEPVLDGSDGAARRTGLLIRLLVCAVQARSIGGFDHLKSNLHKQGISSAMTAVSNGYCRYLKAVDSIKGTPMEMSDYKESAQKVIIYAIKKLGDAGQI